MEFYRVSDERKADEIMKTLALVFLGEKKLRKERIKLAEITINNGQNVIVPLDVAKDVYAYIEAGESDAEILEVNIKGKVRVKTYKYKTRSGEYMILADTEVISDGGKQRSR